MGFFRTFAAENGPHISLRAEPVFQLGDLTVTNSMIYGVIVASILLVLGVRAGSRVGLKPQRGLVMFFEMAMEFMISLLDNVFSSRKKAIRYAPTFGVFFLFIIFSNISGLMPVVGEGFTVGEGTLFRPFTADLNGTIALAVIAIVLVQILSIKESGVGGHLQHYFTDKPFNPINMFIGILEVFGEFTRVISLALRLFLNTAVGEILIAVFAYVGQAGSSFTILPIVMFEVLVAFIQAYVFTVLTATYLSLAISHGDHEEHHGDEHHEQPTELQSLPGQA